MNNMINATEMKNFTHFHINGFDYNIFISDNGEKMISTSELCANLNIDWINHLDCIMKEDLFLNESLYVILDESDVICDVFISIKNTEKWVETIDITCLPKQHNANSIN